MSSPIEKLRAKCMSRGVNGIRAIGRTFRSYDDDGNKKLSREELEEGLRDYGLTDMTAQDIDQLFASLDTDNSGTISFTELLEALRPPMSESRVALVDKAFKKLDATGDGRVTVADLTSSYDVSHHAKYKSGEQSKEQILQEFLNNFQLPGASMDDVVTREEWLNYYSGVSASIDDDVYFDYMMRQAWKL